jgi:hypothetical protein
MKKFFLLGIFFINIIGATAQSNDFSGSWSGTCVRNGETFDSHRSILQSGVDSITIEGDQFQLKVPTIINLSGVDDGQEWKEQRVYDWQWNEDQTSLLTSAHWLGWYLHQHGTWSGRGTGKIQWVAGKLEISRTFEQEFNGQLSKIDEVCTYTRR